MTGAMYAAIAGLKTHMSKMNVTGHNIANDNTNGYKNQRTVFKDAMYTMYSNGSNGTEVVGGKNPSQIGYGSQVSSIDLNMSTGTYAPGNPMDCMISGDGFFMVGDKDVADVIDPLDPTSLKTLKLTRVGDMDFRADGYLVDGSGGVIYGFLAVGVDEMTGDPIMSDQLVPIRLPRIEQAVINTDTGVEIELAADEEPPDDVAWEYRNVVRYPVANTFDEDGTTVTGNIRLRDYWAAEQLDENGSPQADAVNNLAFANLDSISIDTASGRISGITKDTDQQITIGFL
ncbi:MAG: flagellar hook-basal body complex protein, partial [Clostridia bacterium]|nr:flagellar hook-basal body complex protein [Clostridia bacterium]